MGKIIKPTAVRIQGLETLRGLAAIYVLIHHARSFLWIGYSNGYLKHPQLFDLPNKVMMYFLSLFIYGHQAVIFFFVLSGFAIHFKYAYQLSEGDNHFGLKTYLIRRIKRIYPTFLFALFLTFVLDTIGRSIYSLDLSNSPNVIIKNNFNLNSLILNISFLIDNDKFLWGSNAALWSLKYEWWFYMLYPILFLIIRKSIILSIIVVIIFYVLSFIQVIWPAQLLKDVFSYLIIWYLGVLLAEIYFKRLKIKLNYLIPLVLLAPILLFLAGRYNGILEDLGWGLVFMSIILFFLSLDIKSKVLMILDKFKNLGSFSFTLYVVHVPILVLIRTYMFRNLQSASYTFGYVFFGIILCLITSYALHFLIEKPFTRR